MKRARDITHPYTRHAHPHTGPHIYICTFRPRINESPTISFRGKICHADRWYPFFSKIFFFHFVSLLIECRSFVIWVPFGRLKPFQPRRRHSSGLNGDVSNVKRFCNRHCSPTAARPIFVLRPRLYGPRTIHTHTHTRRLNSTLFHQRYGRAMMVVVLCSAILYNY